MSSQPGLFLYQEENNPQDWETWAQAGEWTRALITAQRHGEPDTVVQMLLEGLALQEALRDRNFVRLRFLCQAFYEKFSAFCSLPLEALTNAVAVLEEISRTKETDPLVLRQRLIPALAHPLTKAEALCALGVLYALREESEEARLCFEEALEFDKKHYRSMTNLGNLELEAGEITSAQARYEEALRIQPDYDTAHHNLGVALRRQGKIAEAVISLRKAQRLALQRSSLHTRQEMREALGKLQWKSFSLLSLGLIILVILVANLGR